MTVVWILLKVTGVTAFGLIAVQVARRRRASLRHMILSASFVLALLVPLTTFFGPTIPVTMPSVLTEMVLDDQQGDSQSVSNPGPIGTAALPNDVESAAVGSQTAWLLAIWLIGVACFVAPVLAGSLRVRSLRRSSLPWPDDRTFKDAVNTARHKSTRRDVALFLHSSVHGPITCGVLHPMVVLPASARAWPVEDLERALIHEFEHIRRHDWLTQRAARVICACYWFHPLLWMAWQRLTLEAEHACDDAVIGRGDAPAYAEQLLRLAECQAATGRHRVLLGMAGRHDLATRIHAVLDRRQQRGRLGALTAWLLCLAVATGAAATAPIRLVPRAHVAVSSVDAPPLSTRVVGNRKEVRMPKRNLPIALTAAMTTALAASPQPTRAQEPVFSVNYNVNYAAENGLTADTDEDFIKHAARLCAIEIQAGKLAMAKTSNADVKAFAEQLVKDHAATATELSQWAARKSIVLKDDDPNLKMPLDKHKALEKLTGSDFDRAFVAAIMGDQTDGIMLVNNEKRKSQDAGLRTFAEQTRLVLIAHMNVARPLRAKLY